MTPAQKATLKSFIQSDPVLSQKPNISDGWFEIAEALSLTFSPDFFVWSTNADTKTVYDAIDWAKMTPAQATDGTQAWANRALLAQAKQFNLQTILLGRDTINGAKVSIRAGLQDALTGLPTKNDGTSQAAGWNTVQLALQRKATVIEKIFSVGTGSTASPATMAFEGAITPQEVGEALNS